MLLKQLTDLLSEGIFDPKYANLAMTLLRHALVLQPRLFCLGMGGRDKRLPRMLSAMRWTLIDIPFLFRVIRPQRFLRNIVPLRHTLQQRLFMDALALSGSGWLGIHLLQARRPSALSVAVEDVSEFGAWADEVWKRSTRQLSFCAVRTSRVLNQLYGGPSFLRLKMSREGEAVGWAVLRDTQMHAHRYFGDLRVATIVDAMAVPESASAVARAASRFVESREADLIVSNQAHALWVRGLRDCGFLSGPSNYVLAMSPALSALMQPLAIHQPRLHVTRGDGDGPLDL